MQPRPHNGFTGGQPYYQVGHIIFVIQWNKIRGQDAPSHRPTALILQGGPNRQQGGLRPLPPAGDGPVHMWCRRGALHSYSEENYWSEDRSEEVNYFFCIFFLLYCLVVLLTLLFWKLNYKFLKCFKGVTLYWWQIFRTILPFQTEIISQKMFCNDSSWAMTGFCIIA